MTWQISEIAALRIHHETLKCGTRITALPRVWEKVPKKRSGLLTSNDSDTDTWQGSPLHLELRTLTEPVHTPTAAPENTVVELFHIQYL